QVTMNRYPGRRGRPQRRPTLYARRPAVRTRPFTPHVTASTRAGLPSDSTTYRDPLMDRRRELPPCPVLISRPHSGPVYQTHGDPAYLIAANEEGRASPRRRAGHLLALREFVKLPKLYRNAPSAVL